ncbi:MAG: lipopolysaccharide biosynthesis protein [Gemmataceae bacterium]
MDRSFLRHAAVYSVANFLVQGGSFILLPIYLRCLTPADYGVLEVTGRLAETVGTFLLLGGLRQGLYTFYQQAADDRERRQVVSATFLLILVCCLVGGLGSLAFGPWLGEWLAPSGGDGSALPLPLLNLAILAILLEPLSLFPLTLIQARVESGRYVVIVVTQFLMRVGLCILLVRFLRWGVAGALIATAVNGVLFGLWLTGRELSRSLCLPTWAQLRGLVTFSLPLLPGGLCFFVLHHGDRFFLLRHASVADVGTYALGYKLAMVVRLFSLVPLYMVWSSRMYEVARTPDAATTFGKVITRILAAYLFAGLGLCLFAPEIVLVLGGRNYLDAVPLVAPVVVACFFQSAAALMDGGFYIRRRMGRKLAVTVAATVVILALYAVLIPWYGGMGAAVATVGGFAFLAVATLAVTQRIFAVRYEWHRLAAGCAIVVALWYVGNLLPIGGWGLPAKAALLLLAPLLAWAAGLVSDEERATVDAGLARLLRRWPGRRPADPMTEAPVVMPR